MVVRLPGGKTVVLDSKAPVAAFLEAAWRTDAEDRPAGAIWTAMPGMSVSMSRALSAKAYWDQFAATPEFVVLFLPGESFFSAALQHDPDLIEYASAQKVILATPTTLLALLKAVYYGWRQEALAENARRDQRPGCGVVSTTEPSWRSIGASLGKNLGQAVRAYNDATGSLETRVLVTARKFEQARRHCPRLVISPTPDASGTRRRVPCKPSEFLPPEAEQ
jgi:DNA recombination protein RmuC